jgi:O-antigen/teichoic acid export membrane protein
MPLPAVLVWIPPLILNVVLNLFWIPRWGIAGAAASSSVSYLMVLALHLALWSRTLGGSWTRTLVVTRSDLREMAATAGIPSWW